MRRVSIDWRTVVVAIAILAGGAAAVVPWIKVARRPRGDFVNHYESGRRILEGEDLYRGGHNYPYPPFWALLHAPLSCVPVSIAQPLAYPLGLAGLALLVGLCVRQANRLFPGRGEPFLSGSNAAALLALVVASRYILRDLDECGPNTILLALVWLGLYCWSRGNDLASGWFLGLATAAKCTAGIFVAYLMWKRQWRAAFAGTVATAALTLSPLALQGEARYAASMKAWMGTVASGVAERDPSVGVLGPQPLANKSLRPALARYLMRLPDGHPGRVAHPGYVDVLALRPRAAGLVATGILLAIVGFVAVRFREPVVDRDDPALAWEFATVAILMLLASPITWGHHCVATIPATILLASSALRTRWPRWMMAAAGGYSFIVLVLNRSIIGRELSELAESYHVVTVSLLLLLALTIAGRARWTRPAPAMDAARDDAPARAAA